MFFVKRDKRTGSGKGTNYAEISRRSVAQFFSCSDEIERKCPDKYAMMSKSPDIIRDVFRHSFCVALDLQSSPAFSDLDELYTEYSEHLKKSVGNASALSTEVRQGMLQAGVHYIVFSTKSGKRELDENYVQH